jgi:hypothetical protein
MERSEIRGHYVRGAQTPDYASLHPGYKIFSLQDLALPVGQNTQTLGQCVLAKIFRFIEIRKRRIRRRSPAQGRGRIAIVTNAGRAAVDAGHIGTKSFAGRATVSEDLAPTTDVIGVRPNRVVLAPGVCAPSLAVMWQPDRACASAIRNGDGGNSASLPGESTT